MRRVLISDLKTGILNIRFFACMIPIIITLIVVGYPYYQELADTSHSIEPLWFSLFRYCLFSEYVLMVITIVVPLAAGGMVEDELRSRFVLFSYCRSGKKEYISSKYITTFLSGGLMAFFSIIIFGGICIGLLAGKGEVEEVNIFLSMTTIAQDILRHFFNGGLWAVIGSFAAVCARNRHMSFVVPFILYYVLTVFQSRYYRELPILSPRYWATPIFYQSYVCVGILCVLLILTGYFYKGVIKRRLANV